MKNLNSAQSITSFKNWANYLAVLLISFSLLAFQSCTKETPEPEPVNGNGSGSGNGNGNGNIGQVDVNGLKQNYVNAEGVNQVQLYSTLLEVYEFDGENYTKMSYFGDGSTMITVIVKGNELKEGNFSLKKFRLGSNPTGSEAVVSVGINSTLLDFEISNNDRLSIVKNTEGFYVIKMGPTVGIKRNSWDPELTAPISFHIVNNPDKIVVSDSKDGSSIVTLYDYSNRFHNKTNQPYATVSLAQLAPGRPIQITFIDYDFSSGTLGKTNYSLSQNAINNTDQSNGVVPKSVHISYGQQWNGGLFSQDYSMNQNIEMELSEGYITLKYTDIKMVHKTDPTNTVTITGEIKIAR